MVTIKALRPYSVSIQCFEWYQTLVSCQTKQASGHATVLGKIGGSLLAMAGHEV